MARLSARHRARISKALKAHHRKRRKLGWSSGHTISKRYMRMAGAPMRRRKR